jgi:uncharacterized phiE125 gp8 family phage protein
MLLPNSSTVLTRPTVEPLTIADVKEHLNIDHDNANIKLQRLITMAREAVETRTNRVIVRQKWRCYFGMFADEMRLKPAWVREIHQVQYKDDTGATQTLATTGYTLDVTDQMVRLAYGQSWPTTLDYPNSVWVDVWAGEYDTSDSPMSLTSRVPETIRQAILLLIGDAYLNTEATSTFQMYDNAAFRHLIGHNWMPPE